MTAARSITPNRFEGRKLIVGREGHIFLGDDSVSRHHAEISFADGRIHLRDLGSTNGVYLVRNNRAVRFREGYVEANQPIVIGRHQCTVQGLLHMLDDAGAIAS